MQLSIYFMITSMVLAHYSPVVAQDNPRALVPNLRNDLQALTYCTQTPHTYVVIVWPKGYKQLNFIVKTLNSVGSVRYIKKPVLTKEQMFSLYRKLHLDMTYENAKKKFKPYVASLPSRPLCIAALVFHTDASLEEIVALKQKIRRSIGADYYSIHINDFHDPETVEAAQAVFTNGVI